jgi:hypothetical protein
MVTNKELEAGLKAIAEDFRLPGGDGRSCRLLVTGHLAWFDTAERRGMGWRGMIRMSDRRRRDRQRRKALERWHAVFDGLAQARGS